MEEWCQRLVCFYPLCRCGEYAEGDERYEVDSYTAGDDGEEEAEHVNLVVEKDPRDM